jgi:hypothetical protein
MQPKGRDYRELDIFQDKEWISNRFSSEDKGFHYKGIIHDQMQEMRWPQDSVHI